jgi:lipopolysaccharide transport system permease protein
MDNSRTSDIPTTVIRPGTGWSMADFKELKEYRDLFYFLVQRDIKVLYAQTILGFGWAILNPLMQILIFTIIFGKVAKVSTEGIPYILFSTAAIIPWTYMSESLSMSSQSLVAHQGMLGKIYFPRILFPLTPVFSKLVDFCISLPILAGALLYYGIIPTWKILLLPVFLLQMICIPAAAGMLLSALAIRFRDVRFAMQFVIRMLLYSAPVVYSASGIPERFRIIYSLNPLVGVIEGFRACILSVPIQWQYVYPGMISSVALLIIGAVYFKKMERTFVDVI